MMNRKPLQGMIENGNSAAWVAMVSAVALHVVDEALTGFLPFYNDLVHRLHEHFGFFPAPTFTFPVWIGGLAIAVAMCYALTPHMARGGTTMRVVNTTLGVRMVANALGHLLGSIYLGRLLPGFWSSPLLLAAAGWVVGRGVVGDWSNPSNAGLSGG